MAANPSNTRSEPAPGLAPNDALGLRAYLDILDAHIRAEPAAWVKCELHRITRKDNWISLDFVEHDAQGRQIAKAGGGCPTGRMKAIERMFSDAGMTLVAGSKVMVKLKSQLQANYGLRVEVLDIDVNYSLGDLNRKIEEIRRFLREKGIATLNKEMNAPNDFIRVAVISPANAAGLADFRSTADRLQAAGLVEFTYRTAIFQSNDAPESIISALIPLVEECRAKPGYYCAIILLRGGGASTDLTYLINKRLAAGICRVPVPVFTAIGHQIDKSILDEVANQAFDTPSKVIEHIKLIVINNALKAEKNISLIQASARDATQRLDKNVSDQALKIGNHIRDATKNAEDQVRALMDGLRPNARAELDRSTNLVRATVDTAYGESRNSRELARIQIESAVRSIRAPARTQTQSVDTRLTGLLTQIQSSAPHLLSIADTAVKATTRTLFATCEQQLADAERDVLGLRSFIEARDPEDLLRSGYAIIRDVDGTPLTEATQVAHQPLVIAQMRDGSVILEQHHERKT